MKPLLFCLAVTSCSQPGEHAAVNACADNRLCIPLQIESSQFSGSVDRLQIALELPPLTSSSGIVGKAYYLERRLDAQLPFAIGITFESEFDLADYHNTPKDTQISVAAWKDGALLATGSSSSCFSCAAPPFTISLALSGAPDCNDRAWDGDETGVDCGGSCQKCKSWQGCTSTRDCESGIGCANGLCQLPTCRDEIKNGDETDIDCGGSCQRKCGDQAGCQLDADCVSNFCAYGQCNSANCAATDDKETLSFACGDGCDRACNDGQHCQSPFDCSSHQCVGGLCQAPSCSDHIKNGNESDVDCGGGACPACENGKHGLSVDCQSTFEQGGICRQATCGNKKLDLDETDVDCGGSCEPCLDGSACKIASDCVSLHCAAGSCAAVTCSDGIQNGAETAIDCGYVCACAVPVGQPCSGNYDCRSGLICQSDPAPAPWAPSCRRASCGDQQLSAGETDVDCGGVECARCPAFKHCLAAGDCVSNVCKNGRCQSPLCNDGVKNGLESDIDCGGACTPCATGQSCNNNFDCGSAKCVQQRCT